MTQINQLVQTELKSLLIHKARTERTFYVQFGKKENWNSHPKKKKKKKLKWINILLIHTRLSLVGLAVTVTVTRR